MSAGLVDASVSDPVYAVVRHSNTLALECMPNWCIKKKMKGSQSP